MRGFIKKHLHRQKEIIRAFLLTKLVNKLGYKPDNIVTDNTDKAPLYITLKNPQDYEKNKDKLFIEKQLFSLASEKNW